MFQHLSVTRIFTFCALVCLIQSPHVPPFIYFVRTFFVLGMFITVKLAISQNYPRWMTLPGSRTSTGVLVLFQSLPAHQTLRLGSRRIAGPLGPYIRSTAQRKHVMCLCDQCRSGWVGNQLALAELSAYRQQQKARSDNYKYVGNIIPYRWYIVCNRAVRYLNLYVIKIKCL